MISILLVDDDHASLETAANFFTQSGDYEVDTASSADEALERLKGYSYDAVLSDFLMPGMSGLELWKRLRATNDDTPFIIYADEGWEDLVAETLGSDGLRIYLRSGDSPSDLSGLRNVVEETIRKISKKHADELARQSYRQLPDFRHAGIVSVDADGRIEQHNHYFADMLGRPGESLEGSMLASRFTEQSAEAVVKCLESHAENMKEPLEAKLLRKDGSYLDVMLSASPKPGDISQYTGMLFIAYDMAAQHKKIEAAIKEVEAAEKEKGEISSGLKCMREIVNKSSNAVLVLDAEGIVVFMNPATASLFHLKAEEIVGERPGFPVIPGTPVTAGIPGDQQTTIEMRTGAIEWAGQPAYLVTFKDITSHDRVETELKKVRSELYGKADPDGKTQALMAVNDIDSRLKECRDLMVLACSGILHTNNTGASQLVKLIEAFGINKEMTRLLSAPLESFGESSKLAVEAMKFARSQEISIKAVAIEEVIRQVKAQYPPGDQRVTMIIKPLPACEILANELTWEAFNGIVENGMERSGEGRHLTVSVAASRAKYDGKDYCCCIIEDGTAGIPDDDKAAAFEMPKDITKSGLGLFLVKAIVEGLNGKVWIEDRIRGDYTKGCRFVVLLPAA
jgi:PAS domain S-box-containing protein